MPESVCAVGEDLGCGKGWPREEGHLEKGVGLWLEGRAAQGSWKATAALSAQELQAVEDKANWQQVKFVSESGPV